MENNVNTAEEFTEATTPLKILIIGEPKSGKTLLGNIIKGCLEDSYKFRSIFNNRIVSIDELSVDSEGKVIQPKTEEIPENKKESEEK